MANLERSVPISPATAFPVASITKAFTAMSVLLAAERGLLSLDDDVKKYIPEWADREHHVTIRHLLTHTSGLRDAYVLLGWAAPSDGTGDSNEAILRTLARQHGLNFAPGTEYQYNNGGYNLLGTIVERASGQSLGAFADAHIFKPLGMTRAYFYDDPARPAPDRASGYSSDASGWRLVPGGSGAGGNAGMKSTVRDLLLWAQNFADVRVGTPPLLAAMQTATVLTGGQTTQSGMGLAIGKYRGVRTVSTSGGDRGIASSLVRYPDQGLAVAVLCNMDSVVMGGMANVNVDDFTNGVADIFLGDVLEPRASSAGTSPPPRVTLSADELASKTGLYRVGSNEDHTVLMAVRNGTLTLRDFYGDNYDIVVTPISPSRFLIPGGTLEFVPAVAGRTQEWHVINSEGRQLLVLQLRTFQPSMVDLGSFVGEYRSSELDVTYTVAIRDSSLIVQSSTLYPVFRDAFVGDYMGTVRFLRDARGSITAFTLNRINARGVRFERVKRAG